MNAKIKGNLKDLENNMMGLNGRMKNFWKKLARFNKKHPEIDLTLRHRKIHKNFTKTKEDPEKFLTVLGKKPLF